MKAIIVTGTPGTGKTRVAKELAKKGLGKYFDVSKFIKDKKLSRGFDKKLKSGIVNIKKLNKYLIGEIKKSEGRLIIDSHLSHYLSKKYAELCIVTKCDLKKLKKRLKKRKYNKEKIRENLNSEIFDVCLMEALVNKQKIQIVDTTNKKTFHIGIKKIIKKLKSR